MCTIARLKLSAYSSKCIANFIPTRDTLYASSHTLVILLDMHLTLNQVVYGKR